MDDEDLLELANDLLGVNDYDLEPELIRDGTMLQKLILLATNNVVTDSQVLRLKENLGEFLSRYTMQLTDEDRVKPTLVKHPTFQKKYGQDCLEV